MSNQPKRGRRTDPAPPDLAPPIKAERSWRADAGPPDLAQPVRARILVVDDDERNAFAAVQALEELGHDLVVARSGIEALRCLLEDEYAVILLDLHMPGMDGFETAELIRSRKRTRSIPIVFLTAIFRDEAHVFQAYSAGAVDVVFKPVDPFILKSKVRVLVDLYLKTEAIKRQAAHRQWLLDENARVMAEKRAAERALRRNEARQEAIMKSLPIVFHSRTAEPPFVPSFVSDSVEAITGFPASRFLEDPLFGSSRIHPDDLDDVVRNVSGALVTGAYAVEFRWQCADGQYRYLMDQGVLAPGEDGEPREIFGVILDANDRHTLEEQLIQARKMEAVGQLTGGVAHDFNNLLTVVLGNVDIMGRKVEEEAKRHRRLDAIRQAAERGRDLTRQLLAFARRQHLAPVTLDVNTLVTGFAPLLRQATNESVTINLELNPEPLCVHVDPTQLETALLNLAVNARDAMPEGGTLTIATRPAKPASRKGASQWVEIEVRDTGTGMSAELKDRVFEPFFTTKEVGKGSGLGLSMVYGFVKQSGGHIKIYSEESHGTTIKLYLPPGDGMADVAATGVPQIEGGAETIFVVEDDNLVRTFVTAQLQSLGYKTIAAPDGKTALELIDAGQPFDLGDGVAGSISIGGATSASTPPSRTLKFRLPT